MKFLLALLLVGSPLWAIPTTTMTFDINRTNNTTAFTGATFGTVKLDLLSGANAGKIQITVDLNDGLQIMKTGNRSQAFGFNGSAALAVAPSVTITGVTAGYASLDRDPDHDVDFAEFGSYRYGISSSLKPKNALNAISFVVSRIGGFADVMDLVGESVLPPGSTKALFAMHARNPAFGGDNTGQLAVTVSVATPLEVVPEPGTYAALCGVGLGVVVLRRRVRA